MNEQLKTCNEEKKRLDQLWHRLTRIQQLTILFSVHFFIFIEKYVDFPYALRQRLFNLADRHYCPAHWIR